MSKEVYLIIVTSLVFFASSDATAQAPGKVNEDMIDVPAPKGSFDTNRVQGKVQIPPSFPGGKQKLDEYLAKTLNPALVKQNGAPNETYTVLIQFTVSKQGVLSDFKGLTQEGYGMEEQAIEAIKKGPNWVPGKIEPYTVACIWKQPVQFKITDKMPLQDTVPGKSPDTPIDSNLLVVTDGIVIGTIRDLKKNIDNLYPAQDIESVNIWKGEKAIQKFGEKGKYGVIEFTLKGKMVITEVDPPDPKKVYEKVDIAAAFPGGKKAWDKFIELNLNPLVPANNNAPAGKYTVVLAFIVNKDGSITDIEPVTKNGYGLEAESTRVMKLSPKWVPAIQNGRQVNAFHKQSFFFTISYE